MEEEVGLIPCKKCGFLPYIVEEPVKGNETLVQFVLRHNPQCEVTSQIPEIDTRYQNPGEAIHNLIINWNEYMNNIKENPAP